MYYVFDNGHFFSFGVILKDRKSLYKGYILHGGSFTVQEEQDRTGTQEWRQLKDN